MPKKGRFLALPGIILNLAVITISSMPLYAAEQEAVSLLGKPLIRPEIAAETKPKLEGNLAQARTDHQKNPKDPDTLIWLGRRTAYLGRYQEAIEIFSQGIDMHPQDPRMYRHRGHRYLTVRKVDEAIRDLQKAAELSRNKPDQIEPDGIPNEKNLPRGTTKTNILYHLGLAYYLKQNFSEAENAYRECLKFAGNDDMLVATLHWLYMTLRRQNKEKDAGELLTKVKAKMDVIEDHDYHQLLLMYKRERTPDSLLASVSTSELSFATIGYGVGNWYLYNGQTEKAKAMFRQIVNQKEWAPFGYLAAEAELSHLQN